MSAKNKQVGGNHYSKMAIQPMEYSMANGLDACQHTIIKYVSRFRSKNGVEDLRKAIHTIELLIDFEESLADESSTELRVSNSNVEDVDDLMSQEEWSDLIEYVGRKNAKTMSGIQ